MIDQAVLAEKLGYLSIYIPEHHLVNILMMPSPLQMAVKLATLTKKIKLVTSVAVLPLHDMRIYAGEVAGRHAYSPEGARYHLDTRFSSNHLFGECAGGGPEQIPTPLP